MKNKVLERAVEMFSRMCDEEGKKQGLKGEEYRDRIFDRIDDMAKVTHCGFDEAINETPDKEA